MSKAELQNSSPFWNAWVILVEFFPRKSSISFSNEVRLWAHDAWIPHVDLVDDASSCTSSIVEVQLVPDSMRITFRMSVTHFNIGISKKKQSYIIHTISIQPMESTHINHHNLYFPSMDLFHKIYICHLSFISQLGFSNSVMASPLGAVQETYRKGNADIQVNHGLIVILGLWSLQVWTVPII